jgi:hypothetical protein
VLNDWETDRPEEIQAPGDRNVDVARGLRLVDSRRDLISSELRSAAWPPHLRYLRRLLAEGRERSDSGRSERRDEIRRDPQAGQPRIGPVEDRGADTVEGVRGVKSKDSPDLIVWGSSTLTPALLEQGLVDGAAARLPGLAGRERTLLFGQC